VLCDDCKPAHAEEYVSAPAAVAAASLLALHSVSLSASQPCEAHEEPVSNDLRKAGVGGPAGGEGMLAVGGT